MGHFDISLFLKALAHVLQAGVSFWWSVVIFAYHISYYSKSLWTSNGWWPVDKPEYMACGQTWICGLWTNLDMWLVEKPGYVACGQTWVHSL